MKLAVAGKGGAGKTTFSATASRLLSRAGHPVLAIVAAKAMREQVVKKSEDARRLR